MAVMGWMHRRVVGERRRHVLASRLSTFLPGPATVLDVGAGNGGVTGALGELRPDLHLAAIDVQVPPDTYVPVSRFDGRTIPYGDGSFDAVVLVDVLHHTDDPAVLLSEAARVARHCVVLKDHLVAGLAATARLRLMDWVGNAHAGVALPYNYWTEAQWRRCFAELGLGVEAWTTRLDLYPWPATVVFDAHLHMVCRLSADTASNR